MDWKNAVAAGLVAGAGWGLAVQIGGSSAVRAQQPPGGGGGGVTSSLFTLLDANKDGTLTRDELKTTFDAWFTKWDSAKGNALTPEQVFVGMNAAFPPATPGTGPAPAQNQTPRAEDVAAMMAALPAAAPVKPKQPRRVLVLGKAAGFVHSSIPLAARTIEEIGKKTGAWSTAITYDP